MKTTEEIIAEIQENVNSQYKDSNRIEVIRNVGELVSVLNGENGNKSFGFYTADELTRIGGELSISQYNLIEYEYEALKNFKKSKHLIPVKESFFRKVISEENKKGGTKVSVKDITTETESRLARYEIEASFHEAEYEKVKSMKFAINSILNRIEARIRHLMSNNNNNFNNEQ